MSSAQSCTGRAEAYQDLALFGAPTLNTVSGDARASNFLHVYNLQRVPSRFHQDQLRILQPACR